VKGKLANGLGSQYSHTTSERGISSITNADAHISAGSSRPDAPADLNGLVRFAERRNLVSARVPSRFKRRLCFSTFTVSPYIFILLSYFSTLCQFQFKQHHEIN